MFPYGWAQSERSFAGWVPNVGSHLSFSMIGAGRGDRVARFSGGYSQPPGRVVCVLQTRQTDDFLAPQWLKRLMEPAVVQHWLLTGCSVPVETPVAVIEEVVRSSESVVTEDLTGRFSTTQPIQRAGKIKTVQTTCDDQGMLLGTIHVIPEDTDPQLRGAEKAQLHFLRHRLRDARPSGREALERFIRDVEADVPLYFPNSVSLRFALMRSGEVRLWFEEPVAGLKEEGHEIIARQAYYFIKDMVHHHVHHDTSSDQITPLTRFIAKSARSRERDEEDWRRQTMWSLSREAEKLSRRKRLNRLRESLGIIAYAEAFQKTLMPYIRDPDDPSRFIPKLSAYGFDFTHMRESTRVQVDQLAAKRTATAPFLAASMAGGIAILAMLNSVVASRNTELRETAKEGLEVVGGVRPAPFHVAIPDWFLQLFAHQPWAAVALVIVSLYAVFAVALGDVFLSTAYKPRQGIYGACISLAARLGLRSSLAFGMINASYMGVVLFEIYAIYRLLNLFS